MKFKLNKDELRDANMFKANQMKISDEIGTIGDRFSYVFTPTSIGMIAYIIDNKTGEQRTLTNMDLL